MSRTGAGLSYAGGTSSLGYLLGDASPDTQHERTGSNVGNIYTPNMVAAMPIGELRKELRSRGIAPGGGKEHLVECLNEAIAAELRDTPSRSASDPCSLEGQPLEKDYQTTPAMKRVSSRAHYESESNFAMGGDFTVGGDTPVGNNYSRPSGQNVGNFMTDRNTSRVLAPPGGKSSFTFG